MIRRFEQDAFPSQSDGSLAALVEPSDTFQSLAFVASDLDAGLTPATRRRVNLSINEYARR